MPATPTHKVHYGLLHEAGLSMVILSKKIRVDALISMGVNLFLLAFDIGTLARAGWHAHRMTTLAPLHPSMVGQ